MDVVEGFVDVLPDFGPGQDHFARDEDQQHDPRFDHSVDEAREQLGLVGTKLPMGKHKSFQSNWKLHVARADHILDLEVFEFGGKAELLDDSGVFSSGQSTVLFTLGSCAHHLPRAKNKKPNQTSIKVTVKTWSFT